MADHPTMSFIAECFWTGVKEQDLRALDLRAESCAAALAREGETVRYLGSMLMGEDEVVLCLFEGSAAGVRRAAVKAEIPFERILESAGSAWNSVNPTRHGRKRQ